MRSYNISKDPVAADTGPQQEAANRDDNANAGFLQADRMGRRWR